MQVEATPERLKARRALMRRGVIVLYEDNHLLGLAKPAGLLSQGGPQGVESLTDLLDAYRRAAEGKPGRAYVGLVHRLDRNVSGAMVVAKTSKAAGRLSKLFRDRSPELKKTYLAWVERIPREPEAELVHRLRREGGVTLIAAEGDDDAREARLRYTVVARGNHSARLEVELGTGLPHQIRCQLSFVGHPILGDLKYGGSPAKRPALHALRLEFPHPVGGEPVTIGAPVPKDLEKIDERRRMDPPV
ncbi:MAG: RNA pseudouridine synthase [Planctomycetota bacterium]|nr:RNA pseudouridine synthase [Planctomycetota bacterium]